MLYFKLFELIFKNSFVLTTQNFTNNKYISFYLFQWNVIQVNELKHNHFKSDISFYLFLFKLTLLYEYICKEIMKTLFLITFVNNVYKI